MGASHLFLFDTFIPLTVILLLLSPSMILTSKNKKKINKEINGGRVEDGTQIEPLLSVFHGQSNYVSKFAVFFLCCFFKWN